MGNINPLPLSDSIKVTLLKVAYPIKADNPNVIHTYHTACQTKVGSWEVKALFLARSFIDSPLDGDGDGGVAGCEEAHLREGDGVGNEVDEDVVAVRGDQRGQREAAERGSNLC